MQLDSKKFQSIVETLVETLDPSKLSGANRLFHLDVANVLSAALEVQGVTVGDCDEEEVLVSVTLDVDTHNDLLAVIENCNKGEMEAEPMGSHGLLDAPCILRMLAEDLAMTKRLPNTSVSSNMRKILDDHGYPSQF